MPIASTMPQQRASSSWLREAKTRLGAFFSAIGEHRVFMLFTMMFRFIPTERLPWKQAAIAGVCAAAFFLIGKTLIGIYLGNAAVGSAYGAAGAFVVFLVWVYYSAASLLISYEFATNIIIKDVPEAA